MAILALYESGANKRWNEGTSSLMTMQKSPAPRLIQELYVPGQRLQARLKMVPVCLSSIMQIKEICQKANKKRKTNWKVIY